MQKSGFNVKRWKYKMRLFINRQDLGGDGLSNVAAVIVCVMIRMAQIDTSVCMKWYRILNIISE